MRLIPIQDEGYKIKKIPGVEKAYKLNPAMEEGYTESKRRILVVIQHVATSDLRTGQLMSDDACRETHLNVLRYAESYAKSFGGKSKAKYAFINFNACKTYTLSKEVESTCFKEFKKRIKHWVEALDPTDIFIFGDTAADVLLAGTRLEKRTHNVRLYRGWKHKLWGIPTYNTIDIANAYSPPEKSQSDDLSDDALLVANLLGYVGRCLAPAFMPKDVLRNLSAGDVKPNVVHITSIAEFNKFHKKLMKAKQVSFDLEAINLSTFQNKVLMTQFSFDPYTSYIITWYHKDTVFSAKQLKYMKGKLREFFAKKIPYYKGLNSHALIGVNIGFDTRVVRHWLDIPYMYWPLWDVQAGTYLLDENYKGLQNYNKAGDRGTIYRLDKLACMYGNDHYLVAKFGKAQRTTIKDVDIDDEVLGYGAMDSQIPFRIYQIQLYIASYMKDEDGNNYLPWYHRMCLVQQCQMIRVQSIMRHRGTLVNHEYLKAIVHKHGPVEKRLESLWEEVYSDPDVKRANDRLIKVKNIPAQGLFGEVSTRVIDLTKSAHKKILFNDILELEPLAFSRKTGEPKYDKFFLAAYKDTTPCTGIMQRISQLSTIKRSFINPFIVKLEEDLDSNVDQRIRPEFGYMLVVTGRSNSSNPSLQQIPEHSDDAKIVKEMFIIPKFSLHIEADYSAHEVRNWGILSGDQALMNSFRKIHNHLLSFRNKPTRKKKKVLKGVADPHRQNFESFTGVPALDVSDDQRQSAKGITFGSMYGMSPASLARQIKKALNETVTIMKNFFTKFNNAKKWLDGKVKDAHDHYFIMSPLGRKRNLFGMMSAHGAIVAACERRAQNSEIQGWSSDLGFMASDLYARALYECYQKLGVNLDLPTGGNCMIHDSIKLEAPFEYALMSLHLLEWAMTNGVKDFLNKQYDFKLGVCLEVEADISGSSWAHKYTWKGPEKAPEWEGTKKDPAYKEGKEADSGSLEYCLRKALRDHNTLYPGAVPDIDAAYKEICKAYEKQKKILKLDKKYPLNIKKEKLK